MNESVKKITMVFVLLHLLILTNIASVGGEITSISSRVSLLSDFSINSFPIIFRPNTTQFSLNVSAEILNRDDQNLTVFQPNTIPYVRLNVSLVNQSLELDVRGFDTGSIDTCPYAPGITTEVHPMFLYVNQTDLLYLPDGNYTFWRPITFETPSYTLIHGKAYEAVLRMSSGIMNITYIEFDYSPTEQTLLSILFPLTTTITILAIYQKRRKKQL
ncbi:hypothetical protein EU534_02775 [Candidatus Heimdallarchaeota archaeon]|nr:MAG: hypothetical protein EU534_02775 [Candidatus Heimdallarchaeota archaeon]